MITVLAVHGRIQVSGHANTAPIGADIVCAAVSALTLTLLGWDEGGSSYGVV